MHLNFIYRGTCALLGLTLVAGCSDDGGISGSESASDGTTAGATDPTGSATTSGTTLAPDPTTDDSGTVSDSQSTTIQPTTSEPDTTTGTTAAVDDTTGDSTTTTTTDDETTTTGGTSSTGDDTTGGDDTAGGDDCPLALQHLPCDAASDDVLHALGLNCTSLGGDYVDNDNAVSVADLSFMAPPALNGERTWQVARTYGTYIDPNTDAPFWSAREGDKMLLISSGLLPPPDAQGAIVIADGDVYNDTAVGFETPPWDDDAIPPPMSPDHGSPNPLGFTNCDGVNDCSNTLQAQWELGLGNPNDKMWFSFKLTAPSISAGDIADSNGYTFDFAMFSAEFPEYVDASVNDMFVVWQQSETYTGNVTFINGQPMTVTALWPVDFQGQCDIFDDPGCQNPLDPHLEGTGHLSHGGATGWYKATGGVNPGETFTLAFAIWDMGDSTFDTTALIDNWLWDCEGCVSNEVDNCEITPQ